MYCDGINPACTVFSVNLGCCHLYSPVDPVAASQTYGISHRTKAPLLGNANGIYHRAGRANALTFRAAGRRVIN